MTRHSGPEFRVISDRRSCGTRTPHSRARRERAGTVHSRSVRGVIMGHGNPQVLLCELGVCTLDIGSRGLLNQLADENYRKKERPPEPG